MPANTEDLDLARVDSRQIPIFSRDLHTLATQLRLDWSEARRLWSAGFLSFDPDAVLIRDEAVEAEFVFVGSLAGAGLSHEVLARLLLGLRKPYAYDLCRIYFDWTTRRWRLLPGEDEPEAVFLGMLSRLGERREREVLVEIRELVDNALDLAHDRRHLLDHERSLFAPTRESLFRDHLGRSGNGRGGSSSR